MAWWDERYPEHVTAADRRRRAERHRRELVREGIEPRPIAVVGRELAHTFWGKAWCAHIEALADLASRLPRGRSYLRSGAVLDLEVARAVVRARVSGTDLYRVEIRIAPLPGERWDRVREACAGRIATAVELLSGRLSSAVMAVLCDPQGGIFPRADELSLSCSCPDGARLCKHLAAVLYGVGVRLDESPGLLFTLRGVELEELVAAASDAGARVGGGAPAAPFTDAELAELFGIELGGDEAPPPAPRRTRIRRRGRRGR